MRTTDSAQPDPRSLDDIIRDAAAAFQGDLRRIFDDRLADAVSRLEDWRRAGAEQARIAGRREGSERLSQLVHRLREFESEKQWSQSLLDGAHRYCDGAALFAIHGSLLEFRGARGMEVLTLEPVPLASTPAFATVAETKDMVVALRTAGELSAPIARLVGESAESRAFLFPVVTREGATAVLYANAPVETSAIELLCSVAGAVLDARPTKTSPSDLVKIEPARANAWITLNREEQNRHLRAQRFARVQVAELRLYQAPAVRNGRAERNLYSHLKNQIDAGREAFRNEFLAGSESMLDYFHVELVRTLANNDADLLGPDYPGPML